MAKAELPPLIRALLRPSAYPHPVERVRLAQTHISYVLLAGEHVYKIKKPVNFGFLDFSTLAKRRYYCQQEVLLNSRLCPDAYLGVLPIRQEGDRISLEGKGRVVEYAVHMRRLPAERMMDQLLAEGKVTPAMVRQIADRLAGFHGEAESSPRIARYGDWAVRYAWDENLRQWADYIGQTITEEQDRALRAYGETFFAQRRALLSSRVEELRIRDCHGDLRSDAVCFEDGLCIFDCIEFNRRFRYTDVAGDVGFLAMDLDYRGHPELARAFVDRYVEASGDEGLRGVIDFYKCYRACVRGKVEGFRLSQPEVAASERRSALRAARRYFDLACRYAGSLPPPLLVITCGATASGKSTLARHLGETAGFEVISSDVVRKELAGVEPSDRHFEPFRGGIYSPEFTDRTYGALLESAREALAEGRSVIVDASFIRRDYRRRARRLAREAGAQFVCLELAASDAAVRRRLARRLRQGGDPSDARWEIYVAQKRRFQRPTEVPAERRVAVDTGRPLAAQARRVIAALKRLSPLSLPRTE
jgi:aminoglycoside phosphotransferase family enzyme/predicted kinase